MSTSSILQRGTVELLSAPDAMPANFPILHRKPKEPANDFEVALADQTLCVYVMPPVPLSVLTGSPYLFFDKFEVRVRVLEQPALNELGVDVWDVAEAVALTLHWTNPGGILAHPLQITPRPMEMVEDPERRVIDVTFHAALQLKR